MFNAVVAVLGFDDNFHIFINLFLLDFAADGLNQIAPLQNFVQHPFAENLVPAAGASGGNTADDHFFMRAASSGLRRASRRRLDRSSRRRGRRARPLGKSRVEGGVVAQYVGALPINVNPGGNHIGKHIVKFHNAALFGVVGGQDLDVFFVRQGVGGQGRKYALGAAFYEQAHAGIVGGFKLLNPFHRVGNLRYHEVFDFLGVGGIKLRRDIGGNGHLGGVDRQGV